MTDKEEQLKNLLGDIEKLFKEKNIDIKWFLMIEKDGLEIYGGNCCPVCSVEAAEQWIEDNNIKHDNDNGKEAIH